MASVFLSYYAQRNYEMNRRRFWTINGLVLVLSGLFYIVSLLLSKPITGFIYPTLIESAEPYLRIANLAAVITVTANMTQPAVLKFANTYWQIIIQSIYCICYLGFGIVGALHFHIRGFAMAALLAAIVRLLLLYFIGHFSLRKE